MKNKRKEKRGGTNKGSMSFTSYDTLEDILRECKGRQASSCVRPRFDILKIEVILSLLHDAQVQTSRIPSKVLRGQNFLPAKELFSSQTRKTVATLMSLTYVPTLNDRYFEVGHLYFSTKSNLELFGNHLITSYRFIDG